MTTNTSEEWEKEFDKIYTNAPFSDKKDMTDIGSHRKKYVIAQHVHPNKLKSFISTLLAAERDRVRGELEQREKKMYTQGYNEGLKMIPPSGFYYIKG